LSFLSTYTGVAALNVGCSTIHPALLLCIHQTEAGYQTVAFLSY